jgi:arsenate reductase
MAAAFFNELADPLKASAISAGTAPGERVHPEVVAVMRELNIDLSAMRPQKLTTELTRSAELLVTMGCGDECPFVPGLRRDDWPLEDPKGKAVDRVREIRDAIRRRVEALLANEGWAQSSTSHARVELGKKDGVLFLCTGNSARSQMAEALLRKHAGERFDVYSAGLRPAAEVHPLTLRVLKERGVDTNSLRPKGTSVFLGKVTIRHAIIVCEKAAQACPHIYPFALQTLYWPFEDPAAFAGSAEERLQKFRDVRDGIESRLRAWVLELCDVNTLKTGAVERERR